MKDRFSFNHWGLKITRAGHIMVITLWSRFRFIKLGSRWELKVGKIYTEL